LATFNIEKNTILTACMPLRNYFVSSLCSEALQIKINTKVTATIWDTNVELWCSYIKDGGDYIYYIKMKARNKTSEKYLQIATFYPPELLVCPLLCFITQ
jgi:hypothetical protein